ncbi:MAG: hypothetical protein HYY11_11250 [Candidatus Methylomirabilis oxyfera]|nr:hypothetical protein [Candidatus Methylomirabilis oxyfera]
MIKHEFTLRLIISLVLVVSTVARFSAYFQARQEKERQRKGLEHRSRLLASGLQETIEPLIEKRAISKVQRLAEK